MKKIFRMLLFLSFLVACKKENCPFPGTKIEGTVLDKITLQPIGDALITLNRKKYKRDFGGSTWFYLDIKSTLSEENGSFGIKYCEDNDREYFLNCKKSMYDESAFLSVDEFNASNKVIYLNPLGFLKINLKNQTNYYYKIWVDINTIGSFEETASVEGYNQSGSFTYLVESSRYKTIDWTLHTEDFNGNSDSTKFKIVRDSIFVNHASITEFNITY